MWVGLLDYWASSWHVFLLLDRVVYPKESMQMRQVTFKDLCCRASSAAIIWDANVFEIFQEHGRGQQVGFRGTSERPIEAYTVLVQRQDVPKSTIMESMSSLFLPVVPLASSVSL